MCSAKVTCPTEAPESFGRFVCSTARTVKLTVRSESAEKNTKQLSFRGKLHVSHLVLFLWTVTFIQRDCGVKKTPVCASYIITSMFETFWSGQFMLNNLQHSSDFLPLTEINRLSIILM